MGLDTYEEIVGKVTLHCPNVSSLLAREWVNNAFREVAERRTWSWLRKRHHFYCNTVYNTGTADAIQGSGTISGTGTVWSAAMVGRQFRIGTSGPLHTISARASDTSITIDPVWGEATSSTQSYEIFNAYLTPKSDFFSFISVWDPSSSWQLYLHTSQEHLNSVDAQRSQSGTAYTVADLDYTSIDEDGVAVSPPLPRYEVWPHRKSAYIYPYLYVSRITDLESSGILPRYIRGDTLLKGALKEAAAYPGTDQKPNPFAGEYRLKYYDSKFEKDVAVLEKQDDEIYEQDLTYGSNFPYPDTPFTFMDADFSQSHA
jgi:hypothetical protein